MPGTPSPDKKTSANSGDDERDDENYHVDTGEILQKKRKVGFAQKDFRREKPSHSAKKVTRSLLQDELDENEISMEVEKKSGDITNPFAFK